MRSVRTSPHPSLTKRGVERRKIQRAQQIAAQLADSPFIRLIALGNSVAMGTATELSDLDFFVVTAPGRLWTARFLLLLKAKWLGLTKRPGATSDQADFGFWVDETALDLAPIALRAASPSPHSRSVVSRIDDPYLSRWLATLIPLVDRGGVYQRLLAANSVVLCNSRARSKEQGARSRNTTKSSRSPFAHRRLLETALGSFLGEPIEWLLFTIQRWKVWADPVAHLSNPLTVNGRRVDVVTTRHMLKLHHLDQRATYRDATSTTMK